MGTVDEGKREMENDAQFSQLMEAPFTDTRRKITSVGSGDKMTSIVLVLYSLYL